jgi:hypothetical protein
MTIEDKALEVTIPSYYIDDNIPGVGDRPVWLSDKFKSVADLAKSYHELEKKVGTAPDEYDISNSKFIDPNYAPIQEMLALAKEKRVSKEVIDKMVDSIDKYMDEFSIDYEEEAKKLGDNAKERLTTLDNWAKANLTNKAYEALTSNLKSADAIKALEELRGKMMSSVPHVPPGNESAATTVPSLSDLQSELSNNLAKYKADPNYRKDLTGRLELASKNSGIVDKSGY